MHEGRHLLLTGLRLEEYVFQTSLWAYLLRIPRLVKLAAVRFVVLHGLWAVIWFLHGILLARNSYNLDDAAALDVGACGIKVIGVQLLVKYSFINVYFCWRNGLNCLSTLLLTWAFACSTTRATLRQCIAPWSHLRLCVVAHEHLLCLESAVIQLARFHLDKLFTADCFLDGRQGAAANYAFSTTDVFDRGALFGQLPMILNFGQLTRVFLITSPLKHLIVIFLRWLRRFIISVQTKPTIEPTVNLSEIFLKQRLVEGFLSGTGIGRALLLALCKCLRVKLPGKHVANERVRARSKIHLITHKHGVRARAIRKELSSFLKIWCWNLQLIHVS